jgi:N-acetylglucosamine malate deacetylase 2
LILAHPDDESFMAAGTMARYVDEGVKVVLTVATLGERGKTADLCEPAHLPELRRAELQDAIRILGMKEATLLGYRDQELAAVPPEEMRERLVALIRAHQPQVVLTFDPNGANLHPDHMAISRFTMDAVTAAADPRWHPEAGPAFEVSRVVWPSPTLVFDLAWTPNLPSCPGIDFLLDVEPWATQKEQALRAHRSQIASIQKHWFSKPSVEAPEIRRTLSVEAFRLGWGLAPKSRPSDNLFEGL